MHAPRGSRLPTKRIPYQPSLSSTCSSLPASCMCSRLKCCCSSCPRGSGRWSRCLPMDHAVPSPRRPGAVVHHACRHRDFRCKEHRAHGALLRGWWWTQSWANPSSLKFPISGKTAGNIHVLAVAERTFPQESVAPASFDLSSGLPWQVKQQGSKQGLHSIKTYLSPHSKYHPKA